jgi:hypothetical protein
MKRLIAALLILVSLFSVASADTTHMAKLYNSYAELIFNLPQLNVDISYTREDTFTGGVITLWQDDNAMIGFIESKDGDLTGAFCADYLNNDAEFLVRCGCVLYAFEGWDEKLFSPLFDAYVHARKISQAYALDLNDYERLIMGKTESGYLMYIVPKE